MQKNYLASTQGDTLKVIEVVETKLTVTTIIQHHIVGHRATYNRLCWETKIIHCNFKYFQGLSMLMKLTLTISLSLRTSPALLVTCSQKI